MAIAGLPGRQYWGARLCTSSANHRLLGPPTGPERRDESCCRQCTRWQVQYSQTGVTLRRHFSRAVAAAVTFVSVVAATSARCRGTGQRNVASQMFLQLLTLRRRTPRAVAAAVSFSLFPPCRCGDASVRCRGEEVETLHLPALGAVLTVMVQEHADVFWVLRFKTLSEL